MSSITDPRLAMIGAAIDELAEAARAEAAQGQATGAAAAGGVEAGAAAGGAGAAAGGAGAGAGAVAGGGRTGTPPTMAERVAGIWAMVADLDPGLAQRLAHYSDQYQDRSTHE